MWCAEAALGAVLVPEGAAGGPVLASLPADPARQAAAAVEVQRLLLSDQRPEAFR